MFPLGLFLLLSNPQLVISLRIICWNLYDPIRACYAYFHRSMDERFPDIGKKSCSE